LTASGVAPSSFAPAASPRLRRSPSPWPPHRHAKPASESSVHRGRSCTAPRPLSTRFEPVPRLRSFRTGSSRMPSDLARRTRLVWQCRAVPALSALLPSHPASPEPDCAQLLPGCCDSPARRTCTSFGSQRLTAHKRLMAHYQRTASTMTSGGKQKPANADPAMEAGWVRRVLMATVCLLRARSPQVQQRP
jgi:hypothetical protein